jgi:hypothetical protein
MHVALIKDMHTVEQSSKGAKGELVVREVIMLKASLQVLLSCRAVHVAKGSQMA